MLQCCYILLQIIYNKQVTNLREQRDNDQFFAREVNWLIDNGAQDFQQVGDLWKVIW